MNETVNNKEQNRFYKKSAREFRLDVMDIADNGSQQTPVLICVDCSYSMRMQQRLERVLDGLSAFCEDILKDPEAADSMQLSLVTFQQSMARERMPFQNAQNAKKWLTENRSQITADGDTPLVDAVKLSLDILHQREEFYRQYGAGYLRPWLILIGDGDDTVASQAEIRQMAAQLATEKLHVFCLTVGDEQSLEYDTLSQLSPDGKVYYLEDLKFQEFFSWLSRSIEKTSQSLSSEEPIFAPTSSWGQLRTRNKRNK